MANIIESPEVSSNGDISTVGDNSQPPLLTSGFAARLRSRAAEKGLKQADLHRQTGLSRQALSDYFAGRKVVGTEGLFALADALGVDSRWLIHGSGQKSGAVSGPVEGRADTVDVASIDLRYGLGGTYLDGPIESETLSFSRTWLRQFTASPPDQLFWTQGQGDSMFPTVHDRDIVLVDRMQLTPTMADFIWAFSYGDVGMIKRLRPMPDGSVKILSDNPAVPPETAHDGELHMIGRVVAVVKRL